MLFLKSTACSLNYFSDCWKGFQSKGYKIKLTNLVLGNLNELLHYHPNSYIKKRFELIQTVEFLRPKIT